MNSRMVIDFIARTPLLRQGVEQVVGGIDRVEKATKRLRGALAAAGAGLGAGLGVAGAKAASFERDMQNVNSIVQDSDKVFARTSASVLDLATQVPRSANELAKGAYQIVSAGFTKPKQTIDILTQAGKAASAGLTSVDTASLALVTSLNAYGSAAGTATRVSDLLFQTVNVGQVSFEQLATNLGDFIGIANASGASLAETLSAYASITVATGQASRSATSLQGIYRQLIKPSEALSARLEQLGFANGRAAIETLGLQGTLERLTEGMPIDAVAQLFQDVEGLNGVLALTGPNAEKARSNLALFTDETKIAGATQKALNEQAKGFGYQSDRLKSSLGALGISLGQYLLPFMKTGVSLLNMLVGALNSAPGPVKALIVGIAAFGAVMGTVGITTLLWASRLNMIRTGMTAIGASTAAQSLLLYARSSTVAAGASALLARTTGLTAAGLLGVGKAAGIAVLAMLAIGPVVGAIKNAMHPVEVDKMREALMRWADTGDYAGSRLTDKFGPGMEELGGKIKSFTSDANKIGVGRFKMTIGTEGAVRDVDELDKALAKLVTSGNINMAKAEFKNLEDSLRSQGITTAQINQAFDNYQGAIGEVDLQARAAADGQYKMQGATEAVGESLKKAEEEAKAYQETIDELKGQADEFLGITNILQKVEDKHRKAFDSAEKHKEAMQRQVEKVKDNTKAQDDMAQAQDKVNRLMAVTNGMPVPGTKPWYDLRDAQRGVSESADKLRGSQAAVNAEYKETAPTLQEIIGTYQSQIDAYKSFQKNLQIAASRGVPIEVIRELQGMGEEGVKLAAQLSSAPPAEFDKLKGLLAEKVKMQGEEFQRELDTQLVTAAAIARKGANQTAEAILEEVRRIAPGINAELPAVRAAMESLGASEPPLSTGDFAPKPAGPPMPPDPALGKFAGNVFGSLRGRFTTADTGATIYPGTNVVQNNTPLPEYVLTAAQMQRLVPTSSSTPATVPSMGQTTTHQYQFGDIYAQDLTGAMRQADQKRRLQALAG